jgi:hypothetical protein
MATEASSEPTTESAVNEPAPTKSVAKKPVAKKKTKRKPVAKAAPKSSSSKKPAKKKRIAKKSPTKKATTMESAAKKSSPKKSTTKKRKAKKRPVIANKSQAIRDTAKALGKRARPKDVIAALADKGITVVSAQVSTVLKAAGMRRGRRRRRIEAVVVAHKPSTNGHGFMIDELVKVKKLAAELGGTAKIKELVGALERLT